MKKGIFVLILILVCIPISFGIIQRYESEDTTTSATVTINQTINIYDTNLSEIEGLGVWTVNNFTSTNVSEWDTAYGWGDHASGGYALETYVDAVNKSQNINDLFVDDLTVDNVGAGSDNCTVDMSCDSIFYDSEHDTSAHDDIGVWTVNNFTSTNVSEWDTAYGWGNHGTEGYSTVDTVGDHEGIGLWSINNFTSTNVSEWDTAYGWGDHSVEGYSTTGENNCSVDLSCEDVFYDSEYTYNSSWNQTLADTLYADISVVDTSIGNCSVDMSCDPLFYDSEHDTSAHDDIGVWTVNNFTSTNVSEWDTAYGWGDHGTEGYSTVDTVGDHEGIGLWSINNFTSTNVSEWDTAYGWGDHSVEGYSTTGENNCSVDLSCEDVFYDSEYTYNSSWNQTLADTLYADISVVDTSIGNCSVDMSCDPLFYDSEHDTSAHDDIGVWTVNNFTSTNVSEWDTAYGWGNHGTEGYSTVDTVGDHEGIGLWSINNFTSTNVSEWDTAYGWGDHSVEGYSTTGENNCSVDLSCEDVFYDSEYTYNSSWNQTLADTLYADISVVDTSIGNCSVDMSCDPLFYDSEHDTSAHDDIGVWTVNNFTSTNVSEWDTAYGWGDHGTEGYSTVDTVGDHEGIGLWSINNFTSTNVSEWDTAYGWGDHSVEGYSTTGENNCSVDLSCEDVFYDSEYTYNSSWNQTLADTLYADISVVDTSIGNCSVDMSCDPLFYDSEHDTSAHDDIGVWTVNNFTSTNVSEWDTAYGWGNHGTEGYSTVDTVGDHEGIGLWSINNFTSTNVSEWDTAYGWGDHSVEGYSTTGENNCSVDLSCEDVFYDSEYTYNSSWNQTLADTLYADISVVDTSIGNCSVDMSCDPLFYDSEHDTSAHDDIGVWTVNNFTSTNVSEWDTAYGWGDHGTEGYSTVDTVGDHEGIGLWSINNFTSTNVSEWDTAYGWGDHSVEGYSTTGENNCSVDLSCEDVFYDSEYTYNSSWNQTLADTLYADISVVDTSIGNCSVDMSCDPLFYDSEHDTSAHDDIGVWTVNNFTSTNVSEWDTAYGWGNHGTEGYSTVDTVGDHEGIGLWSINNFTSTNVSEWDTAYGWGDHGTEGYLSNDTDISPLNINLTTYNISMNNCKIYTNSTPCLIQQCGTTKFIVCP